MRKPMVGKKAKSRNIRCYHRLAEDEKKILNCLEVDGLKTDLLTEDQAELFCEDILEDDHNEVADAVTACKN
eukprot:4429392-Ditylum_brightwellii.AAC.1